MNTNWPTLQDEKQTALLAAVSVFVVWLILRSVNTYPVLFQGDGVDRLSGADSYFHLRHAEHVLEDYPHIKRQDPLSLYPNVERGINQGFYDVTIATVSRCCFGVLTPQQILIWSSPVFGGLAILILGGWLWKRVGAWCGLLFGALICAYPGPLNQIAGLGNGDHHAFEVLLSVLLILTLQESLRSDRTLGWIAVPAFLLYLFFLSWPGAPLHLFFVGVVFYFLSFHDHSAEKKRALGWKGALFGLLTVVFPLATNLMAPDFVPWYTAYGIYLAAGTALFVGYPILCQTASRIPKKFRWPGALVLFALLPLLAQLHSATASAFSSFASPRSAAISEHGAVNLTTLFAWYGFNIFALLLTPALLIREKKFANCQNLLIYGIGLTFFWMYTKDFNYYAPLVVSALAAYGLTRLPWRKWTPALLLAVVALPFLPLEKPVNPWISVASAEEVVLHTKGMDQATSWLRRFKEAAGSDDTYGIVAPWDLGSLIAHLAKTPVGWSQTHSVGLAKIVYNTNPAQVYEQLTEGDRPFRFLLIPSRNVEDKFGTEMMLAGLGPADVFNRGPSFEWAGRNFNLPAPNSRFQSLLIIRLFNQLGRNLGHYRLVYETPQQVVRAVQLHDDLENFQFSAIEVSPDEAEALKPILQRKNVVHETSRGLLINPFLSADVRIFEMVPGAVLTGEAEPNSKVGAILSLSFPHRKSPIIQTWSTLTNTEGKFELRLPYPTNPGPLYPIDGSITINGAYRLQVDGEMQEVEVTEEQVQSEARLTVPAK